MAFVFLDKRNVIIGVVILAVIFSLGVIIGYYGHENPPGKDRSEAEALISSIMDDQFVNEKDLVLEAMESVSTETLRVYLKYLTKEPHIAGHRRDNELILWIQKARGPCPAYTSGSKHIFDFDTYNMCSR